MIYVFALKYIRELKNISLYKLSKISTVSRSYLSELESKTRSNPSMTVLYKISIALDINIKDLFYTPRDINFLKKELNKKVQQFGLRSKKVIELNRIINSLIVLNLKSNN